MTSTVCPPASAHRRRRWMTVFCVVQLLGTVDVPNTTKPGRVIYHEVRHNEQVLVLSEAGYVNGWCPGRRCACQRGTHHVIEPAVEARILPLVVLLARFVCGTKTFPNPAYSNNEACPVSIESYRFLFRETPQTLEPLSVLGSGRIPLIFPSPQESLASHQILRQCWPITMGREGDRSQA
jgi:hypothetical protein